MSVRLVDTHCHLDFERFDGDRDEIVHRALDAGVWRIVVPAIDLASNESVLKLTDRYEGVYAAVGVHPNNLPDGNVDRVVAQLQEYTKHPKVVAIGEIGLDYYWDKHPPEMQKRWLCAQLDLAAELSLPAILHNRESTEDILDLLAEWIDETENNVTRPGVLHSFSATWADAQKTLDMGFYVGFTGPITFKKADDMRLVAANSPHDRILIETDAPFLTPYPHRGKRNEPAYVEYVARRLAETRETSYEAIVRQTTENAASLFGWEIASGDH